MSKYIELNKLFPKSMTLFTGEYGCGKTELAINLAHLSVGSWEKVHLIDLDFIKPHFRLRELRDVLTSQGVNVVAPQGELEQADMPIILSEVDTLLRSRFTDEKTIIDLAGDVEGALHFGQFAEELQDYCEVIFVINPMRPYSSHPSKIISMAQQLTNAMRLPINAIVANPNFGSKTDSATIKKGMEIVKESALALNIEIRALTVNETIKEDAVKEFSEFSIPIALIKRSMLPPWETHMEELNA